MSPSRPTRNISFPRGDTYTHEVRLLDGDGEPINIIGRVYTAQIRSKPNDTATVATFSCNILDSGQGKVAMSLDSATTAALTPGNYVYDLVETNGSNVLTLMRGSVSVEHDVTR